MKNLKMVVFVLAVAFFAMTANASAQNLGEVTFQQTISTTLAKSLLYHFIGIFGAFFDTALSLSNVRTDPTVEAVPGTFEVFLVGQDGKVIRQHSDRLPATKYNLKSITSATGAHRALQETTAFFANEDFIKDVTGAKINVFQGYAIITHAFKVGTGVANVIDAGGQTGFNITYVAAQYDRTAPSPTTNTKGEN
jgi:hypothetical protein